MATLDPEKLKAYISAVCPRLLGESNPAAFERGLNLPTTLTILQGFANGDLAFLVITRSQVQAADSDYDYAESIESGSIEDEDRKSVV
mgnify:CR=1 FL=1